MRMSKSPTMILLYVAFILFMISLTLVASTGVAPAIAIIWTLLSSLDIDYPLLPMGSVNTPFVLFANLLDAIIFALLAVSLATFFFEFIKQINITKRMTLSHVRRLKQHVIIVPYNDFAHHIIKELRAENIPTVVITDNETEAHKLYRQNVLAVVGDPKQLEAFTLAGIGSAKYVIACDDDDVQNAMIIVTAKSANARAKIISRVSSVDNIPKLDSAGAYRMIMPEITTGNEMAMEIANRISAVEKPK